MAISDQVRGALAALNAPASAPQTIAVSEAGQHFTARLTAVDTLACAFDEFRLASDALAAATIDELKEVAERLSARLTYLLEPVMPIEVDPDQCVVQMRSVPPQKDDAGTTYYELHVRRGGVLDLCRYQKQRAQARETVPAQVTREVFLRLVSDFSASAA